jgi:hypothetical protein
MSAVINFVHRRSWKLPPFQRGKVLMLPIPYFFCRNSVAKCRISPAGIGGLIGPDCDLVRRLGSYLELAQSSRAA